MRNNNTIIFDKNKKTEYYFFINIFLLYSYNKKNEITKIL